MVILPFALLLAAAPPPPARRPVLVELFTSEGCSSCPPADEVLRRLETQPVPGAEVIPLGFHVDYWDHLGWRDRFSSAAHTARQSAYAKVFHQDSVYTPEMVVDGRAGFVGSAEGGAVDAIRKAAQRPCALLALKAEGALLTIHLPEPAALKGAMLWLAITEDGLSSEVQRGENGGRRLQHAAVVRRLTPLGPARDLAAPLDLPAGWRRDQLRAVVFAQDPASLAISGAASVPLK